MVASPNMLFIGHGFIVILYLAYVFAAIRVYVFFAYHIIKTMSRRNAATFRQLYLKVILAIVAATAYIILLKRA